jgi:hypothetical protein
VFTDYLGGDVRLQPSNVLCLLAERVAGLFIIDGIITVPIALLGFFLMPGIFPWLR